MVHIYHATLYWTSKIYIYLIIPISSINQMLCFRRLCLFLWYGRANAPELFLNMPNQTVREWKEKTIRNIPFYNKFYQKWLSLQVVYWIFVSKIVHKSPQCHQNHEWVEVPPAQAHLPHLLLDHLHHPQVDQAVLLTLIARLIANM